jgi:hypothetical protein
MRFCGLKKTPRPAQMREVGLSRPQVFSGVTRHRDLLFYLTGSSR